PRERREEPQRPYRHLPAALRRGAGALLQQGCRRSDAGMTVDIARGVPKPPPEKPEAEASLLGSVPIDARVYEETVRGRIAPAELPREPHRLVLAAIERVWERGEPLGFQSVHAELAARDELDVVGGAQFLVGLMQNVPTVAHAETYATIVERTALLRRLIAPANRS